MDGEAFSRNPSRDGQGLPGVVESKEGYPGESQTRVPFSMALSSHLLRALGSGYDSSGSSP